MIKISGLVQRTDLHAPTRMVSWTTMKQVLYPGLVAPGRIHVIQSVPFTFFTLKPGMITLSYSILIMMQIVGVWNNLLLQQQLLHQAHLPQVLLPQAPLLQDPLLPQNLLVKIGLQPKDARGGSGDQRRPRDATRNFSVKGARRLVKFVHLDCED